MGLTVGQYQVLVNQLSQLMAVLREMDVEGVVAVIEEAEKNEPLHRPTEDQKANLASIKKQAIAAVALKKVALEVKPAPAPKLILPGSTSWQ